MEDLCEALAAALVDQPPTDLRDALDRVRKDHSALLERDHPGFIKSLEDALLPPASTAIASSAGPATAANEFGQSRPKAKKPIIRCTTEALQTQTAGVLQVSSWKIAAEHLYHQHNRRPGSRLPTLARGLFTFVRGQSPDEHQPRSDTRRILLRGYDKFHNVNEVLWTTWQAIEKHTEGPYDLTLKENGCIIFIAAISESEIVVTSKHSLGLCQRADTTGSPAVATESDDHQKSGAGKARSEKEIHARVGESWLELHLRDAGRTKADLAKILFSMNLTAVAELCDDSFEEHVLEYAIERSGLHLHGLNFNVPQFSTLPFPIVRLFATHFGLLVTEYLSKDNVQDVQDLSARVEKDGHFCDKPIEGFVVRCKIKASGSDAHLQPTSSASTASSVSCPPYHAGETFFFKIKFNEPYLMYREWREITRALIARNARTDVTSGGSQPKPVRQSQGLPRHRYPESMVYERWCQQDMEVNHSLYDDFERYSRGIISARNRFLSYIHATEEGKWEMDAARSDWGTKTKGFSDKIYSKDKPQAPPLIDGLPRKVLIFPIGVPGCGKTTLCVALAHILRAKHIQSDDIQAKSTKKLFLSSVQKAFSDNTIVIADRNNHLEQHRQELCKIAQKIPGCISVCLYWDISSLSRNKALQLCSSRVEARGDNHQSLRTDGSTDHEHIIWRFIKEFAPLTNQEAKALNSTTLMSLDADVQTNLNWSLSQLSPFLHTQSTDPSLLQEGLKHACAYRTDIRKDSKNKFPVSEYRFYGLKLDLDVPEFVASLPDEIKTSLPQDRIPYDVHVTIVHQSEKDSLSKLWTACQQYTCSAQSDLLWHIQAHKILCDGRLIVCTISDIKSDCNDQAGEDLLSLMSDNGLLPALHVTVGTSSDEIKPFESRALVTKYNARQLPKDCIIAQSPVPKITGVLKGCFM